MNTMEVSYSLEFSENKTLSAINNQHANEWKSNIMIFIDTFMRFMKECFNNISNIFE